MLFFLIAGFRLSYGNCILLLICVAVVTSMNVIVLCYSNGLCDVVSHWQRTVYLTSTLLTKCNCILLLICVAVVTSMNIIEFFYSDSLRDLVVPSCPASHEHTVDRMQLNTSSELSSIGLLLLLFTPGVD